MYRKLARIEPTMVMEWVGYSARESRAVMEALESTRPLPISGRVAKILDGNALAATEHRLKALRQLRAGVLPGEAVLVYESAHNLIVDLFPSEDGHAQERTLLPAVVETVRRGGVWLGNHNFCVIDFLAGIAVCDVCFIVREHEQVRFAPQEAMRNGGRVETGTVPEQRVVPTRAGQATFEVRRVAVRSDQPTHEGDTILYILYILTNLPTEVAPATAVAQVYRRSLALGDRVPASCHGLDQRDRHPGLPQGCLFDFAVAVVTYNVLSTPKAALAQVHGTDTLEREFSDQIPPCLHRSTHRRSKVNTMFKGLMLAFEKVKIRCHAFQAAPTSWTGSARASPCTGYRHTAPNSTSIEILWRKIKYEWLPLKTYLSFDHLKSELQTILDQFRSKYKITFG